MSKTTDYGAIRAYDGTRRGSALAPRELEVLEMLATGCTMHEAADRLGISAQTIKNHTSSAYHRLDVNGLVEAFVKLGWLVVRQPEALAYEQRVKQIADALHETCRLEWQAIAAVDPERAVTMHFPDAHYGLAHDLVRRVFPDIAA